MIFFKMDKDTQRRVAKHVWINQRQTILKNEGIKPM